MTGKAQAPAKPVPPCAMVIFGGGGDLTKRLVVPALYNLAKQELLPERFAVVGVDRTELASKSWCSGLHDFLEQMIQSGNSEFEAKEIAPGPWDKLTGAMHYIQGDFTKPELYQTLKQQLHALDSKEKLGGSVLFYLAVPDRFFGPIVDGLGEAGLTKEDKGWRRCACSARRSWWSARAS